MKRFWVLFSLLYIDPKSEMIDTRYRFWAADEAKKKTIMFLWNFSVPILLILIEM